MPNPAPPRWRNPPTGMRWWPRSCRRRVPPARHRACRPALPPPLTPRVRSASTGPPRPVAPRVTPSIATAPRWGRPPRPPTRTRPLRHRPPTSTRSTPTTREAPTRPSPRCSLSPPRPPARHRACRPALPPPLTPRVRSAQLDRLDRWRHGLHRLSQRHRAGDDHHGHLHGLDRCAIDHLPVHGRRLQLGRHPLGSVHGAPCHHPSRRAVEGDIGPGASASTSTQVTSTTLQLSKAVGAGDLLVGWFGQYSSSGQVQVSDSVNGTWTRANASTTFGSHGDLAIFYVQNSKAASSVTITISAATTTYLQGAVSEFSGIATAGALDQSAAASGNSTSVDSGATGPAGAGELVVGGIITGGQPGTVTPGSSQGQPFTMGTQTSAGSADLEYVLGTTAGTQDARATFSSATDWYAAVATFVPASGPPCRHRACRLALPPPLTPRVRSASAGPPRPVAPRVTPSIATAPRWGRPPRPPTRTRPLRHRPPTSTRSTPTTREAPTRLSPRCSLSPPRRRAVEGDMGPGRIHEHRHPGHKYHPPVEQGRGRLTCWSDCSASTARAARCKSQTVSTGRGRVPTHRPPSGAMGISPSSTFRTPKPRPASRSPSRLPPLPPPRCGVGVLLHCDGRRTRSVGRSKWQQHLGRFGCDRPGWSG